MTSPIRRVLGSKDANALLVTRSPKKATDLFIDAPSPRVEIHSEQSISKPSNDASVLHAGQKRKIEHVENVKDRDDEQEPSQRTDTVMSDDNSESGIYNSSSDLSSFRKSVADTLLTSFSGSQGIETTFESQFELPQDEMSQRTLEKLHAVPLPENASQLPPTRVELVKEMSLGSVGMSTFLNLDEHGSSQASDGSQVVAGRSEARENDEGLEGVAENTSRSRVEEEERKRMFSEKAAELRTRLQLALFKVQTNQTGCPFSRLKVPPPQRGQSSSPPSFMGRGLNRTPPKFGSSSTVKNVSSTARYAVQDLAQHAISPESRISAFRAQATAQFKPPVARLDGLPLPQLQPTAFSARWANPGQNNDPFLATAPNMARTTSQEVVIDPDLDTVQLPSSPPLSRSPSHVNIHGLEGVSAEKGFQEPSSSKLADPAVQLSSPPASESSFNDEQEINNKHMSGDRRQDEELPATDGNHIGEATSSPVKGEAANGLLQLMRASSESSRESLIA